MTTTNSEAEISTNLLKQIVDGYVQHYMDHIDSGAKPGYVFARWYFDKIRGLPLAEIDKVVTDGSADRDVDAIDYDTETGELQLYQFKNPRRGKSISFQETNSFVTAVREVISRLRGEKPEGILRPELEVRIEEIKDLMDTGKKSLTLSVYVIVGSDPPPEDNLSRLEYYKDELWKSTYIACTLHVLDIDSLLRVYREAMLGMPVEIFEFEPDGELRKFSGGDDIEVGICIAPGKELARAFLEHKEQILIRNVRMEVSGSPVNDEIYRTCTGEDSKNFLLYNNGVTIVANSIGTTGSKVILTNPQIVNGGQTVRMLAKAESDGVLADDVRVQVRLIQVDEGSPLANQVTVALNHQTSIAKEDIISATEVIMLLAEGVEYAGYYLERRKGELDYMSDEEKEELAERIGVPYDELENRIIPLKEGIQYFVATIEEDPMQMKREYSKFLAHSPEDTIERLFGNSSIQEFVAVFELCYSIEEILKQRRIFRYGSASWQTEFVQICQDYPAQNPKNLIAQASIVVQGLVYAMYSKQAEIPLPKLKDLVHQDAFGILIVVDIIRTVLRFAVANPDSANATWPTLMKRRSFFDDFKTWCADNWELPAAITAVISQ